MTEKSTEIEDKDIVRKAYEYAVKCHTDTNHTYNGEPYEVHLTDAANIANKFKQLLPEAKQSLAVAATWPHDVIEDCRETYNDVKEALGEEIADIVYACSNEKGKTRKARANDKFYAELVANPLAVFVKLCDRIANVEYSKKNSSHMFATYYKENDKFVHRLKGHGEDFIDEDIKDPHALQPMFDYLNSLFADLEKI